MNTPQLVHAVALATLAALLLGIVAPPDSDARGRRFRQAASRAGLPATTQARPQRFQPRGTAPMEDRPAAQGLLVHDEGGASRPGDAAGAPATEAPASFAPLTNGYLVQGPAFETLNEDNVVALRSFNDNRFIFEEVETVDDGVGPVYNAQSCRECHQNVATGGGSQVAEFRSGRAQRGQFFESLGGSLIHSRATHAELVERAAAGDNVRALRLSTSTLGAGFVEAIANATLLAIRDRQPAALRGTAVAVPVLEADGAARLGRFGWKNQHASLVSFAADAYLNEMGITTPLFPEENTAADRFVGVGSGFDPVPEPEDDGVDVVAFADFMRATQAPPRAPGGAEAAAGEAVFLRIGCAICHTPTVRTAAAGTAVNGGAFVVPPALGDKLIHPYSDFLLHDVGTGDGIPIQPTAAYADTATKIRTAPLWGLRTRNRLMHDGLSATLQDAIGRHGGQARPVRARYERLSEAERRQLLAFLDTL